jgi:hypothetical protein
MLPKQQNILGYYRLNGAKDAEGNSQDYSNNGNPIVLSGEEVYTINKTGSQVLRFDDGVLLNGSTDVDFDPNNFSIATSFKCEDNYTNIDRPIFKKQFGLDYVIKIALIGNDDKTISFTGRNDSSTYGITSSTFVNDMQEHNLVCTFDGTDWNIYIDGELSDSLTDPVVITNIDEGCNIGKDLDYNYDGTLGDIIIYNTVLTPIEIMSLNVTLNNPPKKSDPATMVIESDGTGQFINTHTQPIDTSRFKGAYIAYESQFTPFGLFNSDGKRIIITDVGGFISCGHLSASINTSKLIEFGKLYEFDLSVEGLIINGINLTGPITQTVTESNADMYIMARNRNDLIQTDLSAAGILLEYIEYSDYTDNTSIVRDMIPTTNGRFYDRVNGTYYSNDGTGTLVTKRIPYKEESGLIFSTRDGAKDLTGTNEIINDNVMVGNGMIFNGINSSITTSPLDRVVNEFTVKYIITHTTFGTFQRYINFSETTGPDIGIYSNISNIRFRLDTSGTRQTIFQHGMTPCCKYIWHFIYNGTDLLSYRDGVLVDSVSISPLSLIINNITLGKLFNSGYLSGTVDMVEVYTEAKTVDWIKHDYGNEIRFW